MHLFLTFSAALGNMSKLYFLTFSAALGIARTSSALHSLARKLHSLARKLAAARHSPIKQVCRSCSRLAKRATILLLYFVRK